ncbi:MULTISPECIES: DUF4352 domain-containing protein [unclassified Knoellia]|uniref:DUF4352 domain-containing protein n=1 Tax=Knoellia altitudinis TaxID=3404795 RepID=UPI0036227BB1
MNRFITAALAVSVLIMGSSACGAPTEAEKVSSTSEASRPTPSTTPSPAVTTQPQPEASSEPSVEVSSEPSAEASIATSFKVGDTAKVGDWEVTVTKVSQPNTKQVQKWNQFNEKAKGQYVVSNYTAKYVGSERTADVNSTLTWKFGGSDGQVYDQAFIVTSSAGNDAPTEARPGGSLKLDVAFDVPIKAIKGGVVTVEGYDQSFNTQYADFAF